MILISGHKNTQLPTLVVEIKSLNDTRGSKKLLYFKGFLFSLQAGSKDLMYTCTLKEPKSVLILK